MSCVGLWRGLIARSTLGLAIRTFAANSFTPVANQAARRPFDDSSGASVSRSLNGRRSRLSAS